MAFILNNKFSIKDGDISVSGSQVIWDIVWGDQINNNMPTEIQERKDQYATNNETKIIWFLRYRNNWNYYEASNNIYKNLSYKFTEEKLQKFHKNMTNLFITMDVSIVWQVAIGMDFIASKHLVQLSYGFQWKDYVDNILFSVRQNISNSRENHIDLVQCRNIEVKSPFCDFLDEE